LRFGYESTTLQKMDLLAKMSTYVRVIEAGSLSSAARQLRISAAAVSRQISTLEAELGTELIARTTRRMTVTPAGRAYYERCLRVLREVDDAQAIGHAKGLQGPLKVSVPITFGLASAVPHLRALAIAHPALRLDIRVEDRMIDLALEGVDVAIRAGAQPPLSTEIVAHRLFEWNRVLVAAPGYLKRRGVPRSPEALARHDVLSHAIDAASESWHLVNGARSERVRVRVRCSSNAGHVVRDLAVDGAGIAMLPRFFIADELAAGKLREILPGWGSESISAHALFRAIHRTDPRVRTLIEHLRRAYAGTVDSSGPRPSAIVG
jgi:DNA-binding transcriptional LysR family regulator